MSNNNPTHIGFLLLDKFTMISLASAVDPLRMANQLSGSTLYSWSLVSADGEPVAASNGIRHTPDASMDDMFYGDALLVVGGVDITHSFSEKQLNWLRKLHERGIKLGGICTGTFVLAEAGLMDGLDCSVHWEIAGALEELHPSVKCSNRLFIMDDEHLTCSGGTAPLDMVLNLISDRHGLSLANAISEMFILDRVRDRRDVQKVPIKHRMGVAPPKLIEATALIEANIEEPITLNELSGLLNISRRQLERLFKSNLNCTPSRYYLRLRLERARQLLKQTSLSIVEVASICGFVTSPHFSKCYKDHWGISPRQERMNRDEENALPVAGDEPSRVNDIRRAAASEPSYGSMRRLVKDQDQ